MAAPGPVCEKNVTATTCLSVVGSLIFLNVIFTTHVMQKGYSHSAAFSEKLHFETKSHGKKYNSLIRWPQKRKHRAFYSSTKQSSVKLMPIAQREVKTSRYNKSISSSSGATSLFIDAQRNSFPIGCTAEAPLEGVVSLEWDYSARRLTKCSVSRVSYKYLSVSFIFAFRHSTSSSLCVCLTFNGKWQNNTTHWLLPCNIRHYAKHRFPIVG